MARTVCQQNKEADHMGISQENGCTKQKDLIRDMTFYRSFVTDMSFSNHKNMKFPPQ
jgi:hypothetical protein